ncbi:hypothetical protein C7271_19010 [filamentous cyanobacterium CCP5]|nr:hypothetical protein C7271_19010 [filamentous cyanobacterium CCP5]
MVNPSDLLLSAIESFDEVFWLRSATGKIIYANPAFESVYQLPRSQLYDDPNIWLTRVHPDDHGRVKRQWEQNTPFELAYRLKEPANLAVAPRWIQQKATPVSGVDPRESGARPQYLLSTHWDVTQNQQILLDWRQQADRGRALSQVVKTIGSTLDLDRVFAEVTQVVGQLLPVHQVAINQFFPDRQVWRGLGSPRRWQSIYPTAAAGRIRANRRHPRLRR